ncbi:MAG: DUF3891 family protein, partial [Candidatus Acidiferrales bacterium]
EIDLADYLAVRDRAVRLIAAEDPYAALLVSMHTYSLLNDHADRSTIAPTDLPLLDKFLEQQKEFQQGLRKQIEADASVRPEHKSDAAIFDHFRLLQANDILSLVTCVDFSRPTNLLHPLPLRDGGYAAIEAHSTGPRQFVLDPFPFSGTSQSFPFPARHVKGKLFASADELGEQFAAAAVETQTVTFKAR